MQSKLITYEGIVLHSRKGREGGRTLFIFTKENGLMQFIVPRAVMNQYGTGALLTFTDLCFSAVSLPQFSVIRQYEGKLLLHMTAMTYEEMQQWYYVLELVLQLFPKQQSDLRSYHVLRKAVLVANEKNKMVTAFVAAIQLLACAGFNPVVPEAWKEKGLSEAAQKLLIAFYQYRWEDSFQGTISFAAFEECASYIDWFISKYCDMMLHTKGAFLKSISYTL